MFSSKRKLCKPNLIKNGREYFDDYFSVHSFDMKTRDIYIILTDTHANLNTSNFTECTKKS